MESSRMILGRSCWCVLLMVTFFYAWALQPTYAMTENVEKQYVSTITGGSVAAKILAAKKITQSLVTDDEIFVEIERQLLDGYNNGSGANHTDLMAWFCKALASSGNGKYLKTLQQVAKQADDPKLQHYARQSVETFPFHEKRNRILSRTDEYLAQGFDVDSAQLAVMLKADEFVMKRNAAKKIVRGAALDFRLFDIVEQELVKGLRAESDNYNTYVDAMSWMCKALAVSGDRKYAKTLRLIADESSSPKLQRYAGQSYDACSH